MKPMTITGAILLILGVVLLVYQGFSFTERKTILDVGPVHATANQERTVPIPPIIGWVVTGTGIILLVTGLRRSKYFRGYGLPSARCGFIPQGERLGSMAPRRDESCKFALA